MMITKQKYKNNKKYRYIKEIYFKSNKYKNVKQCLYTKTYNNTQMQYIRFYFNNKR